MHACICAGISHAVATTPHLGSTDSLGGSAPAAPVDLRPQLRKQLAAIAMAPHAVAEAIAYALAQPAGVNIGELVVRVPVSGSRRVV
jgi:hypothetical protein